MPIPSARSKSCARVLPTRYPGTLRMQKGLVQVRRDPRTISSPSKNMKEMKVMTSPRSMAAWALPSKCRVATA
eukprot:5722470-Pyramimonas_sp.AAC.1